MRARMGILVAVGCAGLLAHDLYLMPASFTPEPGQELLVVFQNGDGFPEGEAPVAPERLRSTELHSRAGRRPFTQIVAGERSTTARVIVPGEGVAVLAAATLPRFIELKPGDFERYLEHEQLTAILAWRRAHGEETRPGREIYSKYAKALVCAGKPDDFWSYRAGLTIEFVPEANPYALRPGDELPVRLYFRGSPASGAPVEIAWLEAGKARIEHIGRTDAEGRIRVRLRAPGPHRLHTIIMERYHNPAEADWESFWASLTFAVPGH